MTRLLMTRTHSATTQASPSQASPDLIAMAQQAARLPDLDVHGSRLLAEGRVEEAAEFYEQELESDPTSKSAHAGLYRAYSALGDKHRAAAHLGRAVEWPAIVTLPYRGSDEPVPVLLLLSMNAGNVLIQRYLNDRVFQTYVLLVELYSEETDLPYHRLIVNGVGDADVRAEALAMVERVLERSSAPVVNPPDRVLKTGRCDNALRLGGIPGVVAPHSAVFSRESLMAATSADMLRENGFEFPLLLRSPGFHMGQNFSRIARPEELCTSVDDLPGNELIAIQYLNGEGADGNTRKYRVLFIGGKLYPVHMAISKQWKIHYFSADMEDHPEHRDEEACFLNDMASVLGPAVMDTLQRVEKRLGLDYGGIDFGLNQRGEVLLYEANATMAVYRPNSDPRWDYRRSSVERIYAAARELFLTRANGN
jgi:tetratricopeptide (TPR) repeat protein